MSSVAGSYMSDGAILAWVNAQQNRLYDDLKATMSSQEERAQMASDLADLKKDFEIASRNTEKYPEVAAQMAEFIERYGDNPDFAELTETVLEIKDAIDAQIAKGPLPDAHAIAAQNAANQYGGQPSAPPASTASDLVDMTGEVAELFDDPASISLAPPAADAPPAAPPKYGTFTKETVTSWLEAIDQKLDASGTNEQLAMIHINELKSTIDQGTQMASQLIKSSNDSLSSVINNIA